MLKNPGHSAESRQTAAARLDEARARLRRTSESVANVQRAVAGGSAADAATLIELQQIATEIEANSQALDRVAASLLGHEGDSGDLAPGGARLQAREQEIQRLLKKFDEQLRYRERLNLLLAQRTGELKAARAELTTLRESFAFRVGGLIVSAARHPRGWFALPGGILAIVRDAWPRVRRRLSRGFSSPMPDDKPDLGPDIVLTGEAAEWASRSAESEAPVRRMLVGTDTAPRLLEDLAGLRIATVMDEFSFNAYRHCGDLRQIGAASWRAEVESFRPHMLLVESAWKGKDESWARKVYPLSRELVELIAWCREHQIPTVFWNKEDPVHLSVFMRTARQFDFVFTTDIDCVRAYKSALGHDQVFWLPFGCQPKEHNPIEEYQRKDAFCFAGSFYAKYPERQRDFAALVRSMSSLRPFEIFDRNAGREDPALAYPEQYVPLIQGALPHDRISLAYKGYRYGININTVKQSQSMFARRAFDLLACNTVTISNFSRGLRMMLGDLVICSDNEQELLDRVQPLLADEKTYRQFRLAGLRKVMSEHTYQDRLRYVLEKVGGKAIDSGLPSVLVVGHASDGRQATQLVESFQRQTYARKELALVIPDELSAQLTHLAETPARVITMSEAANMHLREQWPSHWLACFHPADHYGDHYLTDLALATRYSCAGAVGKAAHYFHGADGVELMDAGSAYQVGQSIPLRRAMARVSALPPTDLQEVALRGTGLVVTDACGIDEFHYCADGAGMDAATVGDLPGLWTGVSLLRLHQLAEETTALDLRTAEQSASTVLIGKTLAQLLPLGQHADARISLEMKDDALQLRSSLAGEKHAYLYGHGLLPVEQLFKDDTGKFNLVVDTEMLVSFVMIFLDADHKRIGHSIRACSSNLSISAPAGTRHVRLGVRVQGPGFATIRHLVLGHVPSAVAGVPGRSPHLVVSRGYPSYEHLYSYAYVHRRIRGYANAGVQADVFRLTEDHIGFSEFEGVDVVSGQLSDLELMIRSNPYRTIMVHSLDRSLWSILKECPAETRIQVWVHGAEIQPWYRRDFSFIDARDRERGIQRSNDRMAFWREFLADAPANVQFVFVSRHLFREVVRDVGVELDASRYVVIHNHIDGQLFSHQPKAADQRNRLLSIRPYSRPTYANDLTVKAILDLIDEPFFPELEFRLIGDGRLFDETVEPLRHLPNVLLERRFLNQQEIAMLHKDYGVFLSPSRIDSQGVSRDEAMASGLVPITNRVSAIPEFVDERCAIMVDAEDWRGIADAIRRLHARPDEFMAMSAAATMRVRAQSGFDATIARELALIQHAPDASAQQEIKKRPTGRKCIAVYGDLDMNRIDGSAVWAASLAEVLAGDDECDVDLFLKVAVRNTQVLGGLLGLVNVRLVEPPSDEPTRKPGDALDAILAEDIRRRYDAVVLRGFNLAREAALRPALNGRLWVYLTDVPQRLEDFSADHLHGLQEVARRATYLLCQTPQLQQHLTAMAPDALGKTRLLPPMVPDIARVPRAERDKRETLRVAYAGKFAPLWGIREMFDTIKRLRSEGLPVELHVFGDKMHNPADDPAFRPFVQARLESSDGVVWHRGLSRADVLAHLQTMHVGWAWRQPALEAHTLELSTKILEYAACGAPPLLAPGPVNSEALGADYPLFADASSLAPLLRSLLKDASILKDAGSRSAALATGYMFGAVRANYLAPLLVEGVQTSCPPGAT